VSSWAASTIEITLLVAKRSGGGDRQVRHREHSRAFGLSLNGSRQGSILAQRIVNTVLMIKGHVFAKDSPKVRFVQSDHVIQDFAPASPNPSLGDAILPW
jgi:hypothetical protein